ncbi:hypothetical protein ES703_70854 [subsurface metagenome]
MIAAEERAIVYDFFMPIFLGNLTHKGTEIRANARANNDGNTMTFMPNPSPCNTKKLIPAEKHNAPVAQHRNAIIIAIQFLSLKTRTTTSFMGVVSLTSLSNFKRNSLFLLFHELPGYKVILIYKQ